MEKELNIAEILKDKPQGTKLYSSACGKCKLEEADDKSFKISFYNSKFGFMNGGEGYLDKNGKLYDEGECVVFPSKEMRDWSKFAWKKGDVLVSNDGKNHVIFERWYDDNYISFFGKHYLDNENKDKVVYYELIVCITETYSLEDKDAAKSYISAIEEKFGGKLNLKTLKIDKSQLEFKDGDILSNQCAPDEPNGVFIFKDYNKNKDLTCYLGVDCLGLLCTKYNVPWCSKNKNIRYATEEEKQRLFKALAAVGKHWNAEKKVVEDIKTEYQFKPFEKVLVRDRSCDAWRAAFFSYINEYKRYVTTSMAWKYCIPYEGNESLLGTTKNVEE